MEDEIHIYSPSRWQKFKRIISKGFEGYKTEATKLFVRKPRTSPPPPLQEKQPIKKTPRKKPVILQNIIVKKQSLNVTPRAKVRGITKSENKQLMPNRHEFSRLSGSKSLFTASLNRIVKDPEFSRSLNKTQQPKIKARKPSRISSEFVLTTTLVVAIVVIMALGIYLSTR